MDGQVHLILFYIILYYTILYYTILYYTILYYTILYHTIPYHTILYIVAQGCLLRKLVPGQRAHQQGRCAGVAL